MEEQKSEIQKLMKLRTTTLIYFPLHLSDPSSPPLNNICQKRHRELKQMCILSRGGKLEVSNINPKSHLKGQDNKGSDQ